MANYKKQKATVNISFTYKGTFYKKGSKYVGSEKDITYLKQYLKQ